MILKPESLGRITLELVNSKEGLTAKMMTESSQVKELLDKSLDGLKNTLSSQGINVNNVEVKVSQLDNSSNTSFSMFKENGSETGFFNGNSQGFSKNSEENRNQKGYEESLAHTISKQDDDENQNTIIHNGNADYKV
jgi:flagellar hook-length control protein FliK